MKTRQLTQSRLKELVSYDADSGVFTWIARGKGIRTGRRAGSIDKNYRVIVLDGVTHYAGRMAWLYVHGEFPRLLRFQNGDKTDCRIDNLREGFYLTTKHDCRTKEGKAAYRLEYRAARREEFVAKERERKFGVSAEKYIAMLVAQDGKCAVCRQIETATRYGKVKTLAVDHDHETGEVRGLLCVQCNTAIGKFKDDRNLLLSAVRYLDKHAGRGTAVTPLRAVEESA